jgi:hypothetical protein
MKEVRNQKETGGKVRALTLKGYYLGLPSPTYPKQDFIQDIAKKCNVSTTTVRNWIMYGFKPEKIEHIQILSQTTGIPMDELWID